MTSDFVRILTWFLVGLLGLVFGSFYNVCIWRIPLGKSIVSPPSHCPRCRKPIRPWDNIPVLSYVLLRGRCRDCGEPISIRYPLVEALTALLFLASWARFGYSLLTLKALVFCSLLILTAFIDLDHQVIPFSLSIPGLVLGLGFSLLPQSPIASRQSPIAGALIGAVAGAAFVIAAWLLWRYVLGPIWRRYGVDQKQGIGGGDLPYAAMLGAFLGLKSLLVALFAAVLFGIIAGYALRAAGRARKGQPMPFGPFLALGGLLGLFLGPQLFSAYARLVGLQ